MPMIRLVPATPDTPAHAEIVTRKNPSPDAPKRRRRKEVEIPYLTFAEVERLFRVIDSPRDRAMFRVAYQAGLRASEVGMLQLRDWGGAMLPR